MVLRAQISFAAISRSMNDAAAYGKATKHVIRNLLNSTYKKHETQLFYGQSGLAAIASIDDVNGFIQIADANWAAGIWVGGEKMKLEFVSNFDIAGEALVTSVHQIRKVDMKNKRLYTTLVSGENLTALKARLTGGETLDIFEKGAFGKEFMGLHRMLSKVTGTIFGISTDYSLWTANQYPVGGALTFDKVSDAISEAVAKGLEGKLTLIVNSKTWADLLSEQTAKRLFDQSYDVKKYENGSQSIMFYSQNGLIEIVASNYVKESHAFGLSMDCFERIGSSDVTMNIPGRTDEFMLNLQDYNGVEYRTYCDVALFCNQIGIQIFFSGIIN